MAGTTRKPQTAAAEATTVPLAEVAQLDSVLKSNVVAILNAGSYTTFSTGSDGFRAIGKGANQNGHRYQISVQLVRIGSKDSPAV